MESPFTITRRLMFYGAAIGFGLALLWHFSNIALFGSHFIQEPSTLRLYSEMTLVAIIIVLGITNFVLDLLKRKKNKEGKRK